MKLAIFVFILFLATALQASNTYTVSLGADSNGDVYLLQIDDVGNILKAPKKIATNAQLGGICDCPTAIVPLGSDELSVWIVNEDQNFFRINVDKNTFKTLSIKPIPTLKTTDENVISASQVASPSFLASEKPTVVARAFGLTASGSPSGNNWRLIPRIDGGNDEVHVSSDGRMAVAFDTSSPEEVLYIQPLKSTGLPDGPPETLGSEKNGEGPDVSNPTPNGTRIVVWRSFDTDLLSLQVVDANTGAKVGPRKSLFKASVEEHDQSIAVDPLAHFFLYTEDGKPEGCLDHDIVMFQALDPNGNLSGKSKVLVGCDFIASENIGDDILGIDIFLNQ